MKNPRTGTGDKHMTEEVTPVSGTASPIEPLTAACELPASSCPLCGSGNLINLYEITRYAAPFKVDRCGGCRFIFMNPRFTDATIRGFYGEDYYKGNAEYAYYDERDAEKYARHVWDRRLKVIQRYIRAGRLLDVGAAFGGFLRAASTLFETAGIEPSHYAGNYARKRMGSQIHVGTLDDHIFARDYFLVITMIEVLEHMADPAAAIRECHRLLQKGGLLVVQTANMDGLQARLQGSDYAYYMPGHLSYFSKRNLIGLLKNAGFSRIKVFHPVEFGLMAKLKKSRYGFRSVLDYRRWLRIAAYHYLSKIHFGNFCATSSMVIYAFK